jgi:hypothetical protein
MGVHAERNQRKEIWKGNGGLWLVMMDAWLMVI